MRAVDIFIKAYHKDFALLKFALLSIKKNVTGYNNLVLLIPENEKDLFDTREVPEWTFIHYVPEYGEGYLLQQWFKLSAWKYCFSEFIMFSDADCIFTVPINLQDYVTRNPEILYTDWDKVGDAICWKEPTERLIGEPVIGELMRRNNQVFYRETLVNLCNWKPDLESLIMSSKHFSEFNLIGAYAHRFEPQNYTFINTSDWDYVPPKSIQVWSHASKEEGVSETHLRELIRTLETILKLLGHEI